MAFIMAAQAKTDEMIYTVLRKFLSKSIILLYLNFREKREAK
jgi:hypothetical protein